MEILVLWNLIVLSCFNPPCNHTTNPISYITPQIVGLTPNYCRTNRTNRSSHRSELKYPLVRVPRASVSEGDAPKIKEREAERLQHKNDPRQDTRIERLPSTRTPSHNIREEIVRKKRIEVSQMKKRLPLSVLEKDLESVPHIRDFIGALKTAYVRTGLPALIAEVKKASPSKGLLREDFNPVEIAKAYYKGGAACISVLTEKHFFQGSFENLENIRGAGVKCPLLCKDFFIDVWQIYYARIKGADAVLLIAAVLSDADIIDMIKICKVLGLAALVEVHSEREMDRVLGIEGIELIGINHRNLETFEIDITMKLLEGERGQRIREKGIIVVAESGICTNEHVAYVQKAGAQAVLVGTSLVTQRDPTRKIIDLFGKDIAT